MFVLIAAGVKIECGGVRHVTSGVVRHDGEIIAYLILVGPPFERIKGIAHWHVGRPCNAAVGAVGIE